MGIRRGDKVVVIAGKDKGKTGRVITVDEDRVTVEGVNTIIKHEKARSAQKKSKRDKCPGPFHVSNVQILCKCGKATRIAHKIVNGKKNRVCAKCNEILDKKFVKLKAKELEGTEAAVEKEEKAAEKKPLARREVKHTAESKIKKPQHTAKPTTTHRQIGGS